MPTEKELINERLRKLEEIRKLGVNPYPYKYEYTAQANELNSKYEKLKNEEKIPILKILLKLQEELWL